MNKIKSKINPIMTLKYIVEAPEGKYFDRKSAKIKPAVLAELISGFANAEGGTIVVGISDSDRKISGINYIGEEGINNLVTAPKNCCRPMPKYDTEFFPVKNVKGQPDRLLLLHIYPSREQIIRTNSDATYLRIGDRSKEIKGEDLRNLEYSKSTRQYEDECNFDAEINDLDQNLLAEYKKAIGAEDMSTEKILRARGFMKRKQGRLVLTNAAVLLFAENIAEFYPNCRVRFLRYAGNSEGVGMDINIVKDINVEMSILQLIPKIKEVVSAQLREFMSLEAETGKFKVVPEYPEFAWQEGIVNAITHREYAIYGDYIRVKMFDDRLEIQSPGCLPNIVTVSNIKETRYSRNPRIARVLTEFGWVRELNEGVPRIFADMNAFRLAAPEYSEPDRQMVKLVLYNDINIRTLRYQENAQNVIGGTDWEKLDDLSKAILIFIVEHKEVKTSQLVEAMDKSAVTIQNRLKRLIAANIVERVGKKFDPKQYYKIKMKY